MTPDKDMSVGEVHADLSSKFELDKRLRHVEVEQAATAAAMGAMKNEVSALRVDQKEDKAEILTAIAAAKTNPWPVVGALSGVAGVLTVVFAAIYGQ